MTNNAALFTGTFKNVVMNLNGRFTIFSTKTHSTTFHLMDNGTIECHRADEDGCEKLATITPAGIDTRLNAEEFAKGVNGLFNGNFDKFEDLFK